MDPRYTSETHWGAWHSAVLTFGLVVFTLFQILAVVLMIVLLNALI